MSRLAVTLLALTVAFLPGCPARSPRADRDKGPTRDASNRTDASKARDASNPSSRDRGGGDQGGGSDGRVASDARATTDARADGSGTFLTYTGTAAFVRLADQLARAESGGSVDFDGDGFAEYKVTKNPDGSSRVEADLDQDAKAEYVRDAAANGDWTATLDENANGKADRKETYRVGPPATYVVWRDRNGGGVLDERTTFTFDSAAETFRRLVEVDARADGNFTTQSDTTEPRTRDACSGPSTPTHPCGSLGLGCSFPSSGSFALLRATPISVAEAKGLADLDGKCSADHATQIAQAVDCATTDGQRCLDSTNVRMALGLRDALAGVGVTNLKIACGNKCTNSVAQTKYQAPSGPYGWKHFDSKMNINGAEWDNLDASGRCNLMLHELLHWAGFLGSPTHDDGDDEVYSCGRYCGKCSAALRGGDRPQGRSADCATCSSSPRRKAVCGSLKKWMSGPCSMSYAPGWGSNPVTEMCESGSAPCANCQWLQLLSCDGTGASLIGPQPLVCCEACPCPAAAGGCVQPSSIFCGSPGLVAQEWDRCVDGALPHCR